MKKVLAISLLAFTSIALTGCEIINSLLNGEKQYNEADFKVLIADADLSFSYTKCKGVRTVNDKESEREYTYDSTDNAWHYTYIDNIAGSDIEMKGSVLLDIKNDLIECDLVAKLVKRSVDSIYKFYTTKDGYKMTASYQNDDSKTELEYLYNKNGLASYKYSKTTNLNTVNATTKKRHSHILNSLYLSNLGKSAILSMMYVGFFSALLNSSKVVSPLNTTTVSTLALSPATISV